jgi:hypothetical protein
MDTYIRVSYSPAFIEKMANNEGLFEEAVVEISPDFFPHLDFVVLGGIQNVQLSQAAADHFVGILQNGGYEGEWDADRTVCSIRRPGDNDAVAQLTMRQVGDNDDYEFQVMGPDEVAVGEVVNMDQGGIMFNFFETIGNLPEPNQNNAANANAMELDLVGGRHRSSGRKRRTTRKRKVRKTRKGRKGRKAMTRRRKY